jgi:hypothetical protein
MANVQLVRTRQAYATTTINEVQSIQLVQTMLHGALSSLTYLRELFPEKAFEDRYYEMRENPLPYADFAAARMPSLKGEADPHSTRVPILLRQRSKRADLFLDWLVSTFARPYSDVLTNCRRRESSRSLNQASCAQCNYSFIPIRQAAIQCSRHTRSPSITPSAKIGDAHQAAWSPVHLRTQWRRQKRRTQHCSSFCAT